MKGTVLYGPRDVRYEELPNLFGPLKLILLLGVAMHNYIGVSQRQVKYGASSAEMSEI
jgi:hypothetical protein